MRIKSFQNRLRPKELEDLKRSVSSTQAEVDKDKASLERGLAAVGRNMADLIWKLGPLGSF